MEQYKTKKNNKKVLKVIGDVAFFTVIGLLVLFAIHNGIDQHTRYSLPIFGYRTSVITSSSMANRNPQNDYLTDDMKQIQKYDMITTKMVSYEEIELYDVITYYGSNTLICHRVVDKYETEYGEYIVTRGDANNVNDEPINYSLFRGKVVNVIPKVGQVVLFLQSPFVSIAVFGSLFFVCLGIIIFSSKKKNEEKAITSSESNDIQSKDNNSEVN